MTEPYQSEEAAYEGDNTLAAPVDVTEGRQSPRVGWVYSLIKPEMDDELRKFGLPVSGTMDEKRRRLVKFLREGRVTPQVYTGTSPFVYDVPTGTATITAPTTSLIWTTSTATTVQAPSLPATVYQPVQVPAFPTTAYQPVRMGTPPPPVGMVDTSAFPVIQVDKWRLQFTGYNDPVAFLERLEEIATSHRVPPPVLLHHMPELLVGDAALWFRNNRRCWTT